MSEEDPKEVAARELHAAREALVEKVEKAYVAEYRDLGNFFKANNTKIARLQEQLDERVAEAGTRSQEAIAAWSKLAESDLVFPVETGRVVPWTMRVSTEELWLAVGNNEIVVVDFAGPKANTCWFAAPDADEQRTCYLCGRRVFLPDGDANVSVIPNDPKELAAALKGLEDAKK